MKPTKYLGIAVLLQIATTHFTSAANLLLDFGATAVSASDASLSPGHAIGGLGSEESTWNTVSASVSGASVVYSDGAAATGVGISTGLGSSTGINFSTPVASTNLTGTGGGVAGQQSLTTSGSIYSNTAVGRDGFFGTNTTGLMSVGLQITGLEAGQYVIYVMARNTNSNIDLLSMNVYAASGSASSTFDYSALVASTQANTGYTEAEYTDQYNTFQAGENYVAINVNLAAGEALFLAVEGTLENTRGFLNSVEVVSIPEPSVSILGGIAIVGLLRRRRIQP